MTGLLPLDMPLLEFEPLHEGVLIKRYKRFLADIELSNGELVTAHCANTGPMTGVLIPGQRVRLRHAPSPKRKLAWTWEQAEVPGADGQPCWAGINTALPNRLIRATVEAGCLFEQLGAIGSIRAEVAYGTNRRSRIDLLLTPAESNPDQRLIYLEVKSNLDQRNHRPLSRHRDGARSEAFGGTDGRASRSTRRFGSLPESS